MIFFFLRFKKYAAIIDNYCVEGRLKCHVTNNSSKSHLKNIPLNSQIILLNNTNTTYHMLGLCSLNTILLHLLVIYILPLSLFLTHNQGISPHSKKYCFIYVYIEVVARCTGMEPRYNSRIVHQCNSPYVPDTYAPSGHS